MALELEVERIAEAHGDGLVRRDRARVRERHVAPEIDDRTRRIERAHDAERDGAVERLERGVEALAGLRDGRGLAVDALRRLR